MSLALFQVSLATTLKKGSIITACPTLPYNKKWLWARRSRCNDNNYPVREKERTTVMDIIRERGKKHLSVTVNGLYLCTLRCNVYKKGKKKGGSPFPVEILDHGNNETAAAQALSAAWKGHIKVQEKGTIKAALYQKKKAGGKCNGLPKGAPKMHQRSGRRRGHFSYLSSRKRKATLSFEVAHSFSEERPWLIICSLSAQMQAH